MVVNHNLRVALVGAALCAALSGCATDARPADATGAALRSATTPAADLVLHRGRIVTADDAIGRVTALAARGDRIVAVGSEAEIEAHIGPATKVIDLDGRTAIPGFIEGHGHFTSIGNARQILDLTQVARWGDVVDMVAAAARSARPGEWILGRGWHQEKWDAPPAGAVEGFPTHHSVSAVTPDNPVALTHASGHAAFFNHKAMELAGVTGTTRNPPGGEILKDADGEPIGVFRETAQGLVRRVQQQGQLRRSPAERRAALQTAIRLADRECLSKGVTSFQDAGSSFSTIDVLHEMAEAGELGTRLWVMVRTGNDRLRGGLRRYKSVGAHDHKLTVRAIKRSIDGALGPRGAWLLEPYADLPESTGLETSSVEDVTETARLAREHGYQLCVHAIGDRANREVLDIFEKTWADDPAGLRAARWRVEHAQHLHPDDIGRFGELGVIASMQGVHCTSDGPWVIPRLGERRAREGAYVWRKLIDSDAVVTNGTDAPVEDVDPIVSYHASVTRQMKNGDAFFPEQCMTRMEALKSYTLWAAWAAFEEDLKGSLTPGKLADLVVLSNDITTCPEDEILETEVLYTIVGGAVLYDARAR